MNRIHVETPVGVMALESQGDALTALYLPCRLMEPVGYETALLSRGREELLEYFQGKRRRFDLPLSPAGTPFQQKVWKELAKIPYGTVLTYGELARLVEKPKACRAVGQANHKNPLPIFLPCHRVVGAKGALTGYAGGLELKRFLLKLEGSISDL